MKIHIILDVDKDSDLEVIEDNIADFPEVKAVISIKVDDDE